MRAEASSYPVVVGGHICLDLIPDIAGGPFRLAPGKLLEIGRSKLATGGAVANTGVALHRLGVDVKLMGKVGDDFFGEAVLSLLRSQGEALADDMIVAGGEPTSYSIVISPPGTDRMFLHCTGANDTFAAADASAEALAGAGLFHFGYPPLMRSMYENGGAELAVLMKRAKEAGATTSLDMASPDPDGKAADVDWRALLAAALPHVDLFLPSVEEILYMLRREQFEELKGKYGDDVLPHIGSGLLGELAEELLGMGAAVVVLKLGDQGLYMRSAEREERLLEAGRCRPAEPADWLGRELYVPCFGVEVAGTTGAGDSTIAGFLSGFIKGLGPEEVMLAAAGVGACSVERPDATSGIPSWQQVLERMSRGWAQHRPVMELAGYVETVSGGGVFYRGGSDRQSIMGGGAQHVVE